MPAPVFRCALALVASLAAPAHADAPRDALRAWLREVAKRPPAAVSARIPLEPARPVPDQAVRGYLLVIDGDRVLLEGAPLSDDASLARTLGALRERMSLLDPQGTLTVIVDVRGATPWPIVVRSLDRLARAGVADVAFRFAYPSPPRPFVSSPIDGELAKIAMSDASKKAVQLVQLSPRVFSGCPAAGRALGALGGADPAQRAELWMERLDELLGDSRCVVDPPTAQAFTWALFGGATLQTLAVRLDRKAKLRVAAPAHATWHEVAGKLDAAFAHRGTPVALEVR